MDLYTLNLLLSLLLHLFTVNAQEQERCRKNVDLGFLMDSSGSIGDVDYQKEKDFVKSLASTFILSRRNTQAGVIIYSDDAQMYSTFGQYPDIERFKRAVDSLPYLRKRTRIDKALKLASTRLFTSQGGARHDKEDIMIILTDGVQTPDPDAVPLREAVRPLHEAGVRVFAIGVGGLYSRSELLQLVRRPSDVYEAENFDDLLRLVKRIARGTCAPAPVIVPKCRYRADLGFVMDASNSIGEPDFQKERDFVESLASAFTFGRNETAAAVITYSDIATLNIPLGQHYSAERFQQAVERIPYTLGRTRIDKALQLASTDIFSERGGTRPGLPKLMVILTDGVQTPDPDAIPLNEAVIPLQNKGVTIFAVGVGSKIDYNELRSMVQRDDDVFTATDFDDLLNKAYQISERTCEDVKTQVVENVDGGWSSWQPWDTCIPSCGGGLQTRRRACESPFPQGNGLPCQGPASQTRACNQQPCKEIKKCTARADIGFVMDASASIGEFDFQKERDFVKAVADSFTLAHDQAIVGVITYSDNAKLDIPLGKYMSADRFKLEVDRIPYILGRTRIDKALKLASTDIFGKNGRSRPGFPKIMIILTDGVQTPDPDAIPLDQAVIPLRRAGVRVFAVGVGGHTRPSELRLMVERPDDVFMAADFDDLLKKTYVIAQRTCEKVQDTPVDGEWSSWQKWDKCVPECGGGKQTRRRLCNNPSPAHGGRSCPGSGSETRACNQQPCIGKIKCSARIDLAFLMDASGSIGEYDFQKERDFVKAMASSFTFARDQTLAAVITYNNQAYLDIPFGRHLNKDSFRLEVDQVRYTLGQTRIDKALATAAEKIFAPGKGTRPGFPKVIVILTDGVQTRDPDAIPLGEAVLPLRRKGVQIIAVGVGAHADPNELRQMVERSSDVYTVTDFDDLLKKAYDIAQRTCDSASRPRVNGDWSEWSGWTACSVSCGRGIHTRKRNCDNPYPSNGGYSCSGQNEEQRPCNQRACIGTLRVDGGWSDWSRWSRCSVTCGTGVKSRQRSCDSPYPSNGGYSCSGRREERQACTLRACAGTLWVDGGWSDWSRWSRCSVTCGTGVKSRQRRCDSPYPSNGGYPCSGPSEERQACSPRACATVRRVDGQWSQWSSWGRCSRTCGGGFRSRNRACSDPSPSNGGRDCYGWAQETQPCAFNSCPARIDGQWAPWSDWTKCSTTCGGGAQSRFRACSNPSPSDGGRDCDGIRQQSRLCSTRPCTVPVTTTLGCQTLNAMVGIVMVGSRSVGQENFRKQKDFVKRVAASYGLSSTGTQAGIIAYSNSAQVYAKMGEHTDQDSFEQAVDRVVYTRGTSRIDKALRLASLRFFPTNGVVTYGVPKILIVLINEPQTREFDTVPLYQAVLPLRIANVKVYAIGIGQQVNRNELNLVAEDEKHVFLARDFDDLLARSRQVIRSSCSGYSPNARPPCLGTSDLGFILDASGSVGSAGFNKQRQFVTSVSSSFNVGPSSTHIGVITYGGFAVVRLRFGEFNSRDQITRAVRTIPYTRGQSRIDDALKQATNDLYTVSGGARWEIPKIAIILSDGLQVRNPDVELRQGSEALRRAGVKIIAVGIGNDRDSDNLRLLVKSNNHVVIVSDYDELLRRASEIALLTCNGVRGSFPTLNPGNIGSHSSCPNTMDLGFAVDSSSSLGRRNYLKEKEFVKKVATHLNLRPDGIRAGVLIYGENSMIEITMAHHRDSKSFGRLVDRLPFYSQRKRIDNALKTANALFQVSPQSSRQASKVLVLIVHGKQTPTERFVPLSQAVQSLRNAGVRIIVIGVGNVSANELRSVAANSRDVYVMSNFDVLLSQAKIFKRIICEAGARYSRRG